MLRRDVVRAAALAPRTQRRKRVVWAVRAATANGDPVALIRDVKALPGRTGGIGKLKELVEALAE